MGHFKELCQQKLESISHSNDAPHPKINDSFVAGVSTSPPSLLAASVGGVVVAVCSKVGGHIATTSRFPAPAKINQLATSACATSAVI